MDIAGTSLPLLKMNWWNSLLIRELWSAISYATFISLWNIPGSKLTLTPLVSNVRAANDSRMKVYGFCLVDIQIQGFFQVRAKALVYHLNTQAILGMDVLGSRKQSILFQLNLRDGFLHGPDNRTIVSHRDSDADCYMETRSSIRIPPWGESIVMGGLKTSRGHKGPSMGMIEGLEEFTA